MKSLYHYVMWRLCIKIGHFINRIGYKTIDTGWNIVDRGAMIHWMLTKDGKDAVKNAGEV